MDPEEFASQVAGVAALAEPVRRDLYLYVSAQPSPVSRDQASEGVGVPRHTAKFHLDRLVEEGLLDTDFKRPSGRGGPGAGRPTKRYRRSGRQVTVALPERRYDLAGELMARAIDESRRSGADVVESLHQAAAQHGAAMGEQARGRIGPRAGRELRLTATCETLAEYGYEPRRTDDTVVMANCPFHALAEQHTELVCGMNLALVDAVVTRLGDDGLAARLDPAANRCCVVIATGRR
ncbi:MAG: helix-turn-helix transcriptional regulator [Actinomycetes bacterium]